MPGTNSDIINNNDDKLKHNKLYNTRHTMMNDFTRNSIFKRTACLDNFGINCSSVSSGARAADSITCSDPHSNTCNGSYTYSENITSAPIFTNKYYEPFPTSITDYDINPGNLIIETMLPDTYYAVVNFYQGTTSTTTVESGIRGPVEFILNNPSNDPLNTVYYWAIDDETAYTEFIDEQKQGNHRFVRLAIHQANYKRGYFTVKAYAITRGKKRSGITTHRFNILNYSSITKKPNSGITCREYIEYLANWFDVNPYQGYFKLFTPIGETVYQVNRGGDMGGGDGGIGGDMGGGGGGQPNSEVDLTRKAYTGMDFNVVDELILAVYIIWLKSFAYKGATATNRTKLTLASTTTTLDTLLTKTYTYGTCSTNPLLEGVNIDNMISVQKDGWLSSLLPYTVQNNGLFGSNNIVSQSIPQLKILKDVTYNKVSFRMNGNFLEYKTSGDIKLIRAVFLLDPVQTLDFIDGTLLYEQLQPNNNTQFKISRRNIVPYESRASFEIKSTNSEGISTNDNWEKLVRLSLTSINEKKQWEKFIIRYVQEVDMNIDNIITTYTNMIPRTTDTIVMRWIMTSPTTGEWLKITGLNATEKMDYTIQTAGVLNVNYGMKYVKSDGTSYYGEYNPNVTTVSSGLALFDGTYSDFMFPIVSYVLPETKLKIGSYSNPDNIIQEYPLKGISFRKYDNNLQPVTHVGPNGFNVMNYYGIGYSNDNPNQEPPQSFAQTAEFVSNDSNIMSLPGVTSVKDLIGWKIERQISNRVTSQTKVVTYLIGGSFNNQYSYTDECYVSFTVIRDTNNVDDAGQGDIGSSVYANYHIAYENIDGGFWVPDSQLPLNWSTSEVRLVSPTEITITSTADYKFPNVPFRYSPDNKSFLMYEMIAPSNENNIYNMDNLAYQAYLDGILGTGTQGRVFSRLQIVSDEYIKNLVETDTTKIVDQKTLLPDGKRRVPLIMNVLG
uniref:Uncharacterized protein n=1 Tax=viral metagenome TaxID=1070528 RepID=A0A6C0IM67_9ZZZZ